MRPADWFARNVRAALADQDLGRAVASTAARKIAARQQAVAAVPNFDTLRDLARDIKRHTIANLDHYLDQFIANVEQQGGVVHLADDTHGARRIVADIAARRGVRLAAKSKSMLTEEIDLNPALEAVGVRVVETDLGEFIVQLDRDRPSHIVSPIIHKSIPAIAQTLSRELGVEYSENPAVLVGHARRHLREVFRHCDLGISGVNFAVAQSGTLCICTNEGNGRLVCSRPPVHVALMGIEKLIPRMADLAVMLKILARSSTGQPITVYTSLISGPRRGGDPDGPDELHVVIVDAGRRRIRDSACADVLNCIRCGACLNACPVFAHIGGHAYGNVYPGPIGKLLAPLLGDPCGYADLPQASSLCGRCREVCPVRIDIPELLVRLRHDQVTRDDLPWARRLAFDALLHVLANPLLYRLAQRAGRWLLAPFSDGEWVRRLPGAAASLTKYRDLPRPAARTFRQIWQDELGQDVAPTAGRAADDATRSETLPVGEHRPAGAESAGSRPSGAVEPSLPPIEPAAVRCVSRTADLSAVFSQRAAESGMRVRRCGSAELAGHVAELVVRLAEPVGDRPLRVLLEPDLPGRAALLERLGSRIEPLEPSAGDAVMFAADVGITTVRAAVAETGSLVCSSGPQRWRGLSLVPPVHVAIVYQRQIVADLVDLLADLGDQELPTSLTLISGPSKTADVGGILITGMHGPGRVGVVLAAD